MPIMQAILSKLVINFPLLSSNTKLIRFISHTTRFTNLSDINVDLIEPRGYVAPFRWTSHRKLNEILRDRIFKTHGEINNSDNKGKFFNIEVEAILSGSPIEHNCTISEARTIDEIECLDPRLYENLKMMGLDELTPIQRHAINLLSADYSVDIKLDVNDDSGDKPSSIERTIGQYDLMGAAQTGSGKTLAYLIPTMNRLMRKYPYEAMQSLLNSSGNTQYPSILIIVPTRELAQQIMEVTMKLSFRTYLRSVAIFGGEGVNKQTMELAKGNHFLIATPGRLLDFLKRGLINLEHCRTLILDEADRMLEIGFESALQELLTTPAFKMPKMNDRQTLLFSATFPQQVSRLARNYMRGSNCISLNLVDKELKNGLDATSMVPTWGTRSSNTLSDKLGHLTLIIPKQINQTLHFVEKSSEKAMFESAHQIINDITTKYVDSDKVSRILIFCNRKSEVDRLDMYLYRHGIKSAGIHGDKAQNFRTKAITLFRNGVVNVLVASSVASRGLDVPDIRAVLNIGFPTTIDEYVHRVGRTGRMGEPGEAFTLISEDMLDDTNGINTCAAICQVIKSSMGHLNSIPKFVIDKVGHSRLAKELDLRSEYGLENSRQNRDKRSFRKRDDPLDTRYG